MGLPRAAEVDSSSGADLGRRVRFANASGWETPTNRNVKDMAKEGSEKGYCQVRQGSMGQAHTHTVLCCRNLENAGDSKTLMMFTPPCDPFKPLVFNKR